MQELHDLSSPDRQQQIIDLVNRQQRVTISNLCEAFQISQSTARRDLQILAEQGEIRRVHGGALAVSRAQAEPPVLERMKQQASEKQRIGQAAANLIRNGETVFLGSGTTVLEVARNLVTHQHLTVITNSLPVVNILANQPNITLVGLGGVLRASELSFIGHITEQSLSELRAEKVILSTRALSLERGLTNDFLPETLTDRAILQAGEQIILVADHTKCGRVSTALLAPVTSVHILVTDDQTPVDFILALREKGIQVVIA